MSPNPISPYATAKLAGEYYMTNFYRCYGLETVCLRYFNVFGPRQDPTSPYSGVLAKFITQMLDGEAPTIFGDGKQSRDFTYVDNVVAANLLASSAESTEVAGRVFNVATGRRTDLFQTFQILKKLTGYSGDVKYAPGALRRREALVGGHCAGGKTSGLQTRGGLRRGAGTNGRVVSQP